jgi:hypothetical protein
MREVNFSIPSNNKASVGITTALYDRRALDCTSTLPLINSLNHLAYLTTSSARIRDILTIDGGIERLVVILKEGRSKELMSMWKWNLAFQCVVNIGVRGSENVRTRVVEADMVPVIATILDNYIQVMEKVQRRNAKPQPRDTTRSFGTRRTGHPASIDIPNNLNTTDHILTLPRPQIQDIQEIPAFNRNAQQQRVAQDSRQPFQFANTREQSGLPTNLQIPNDLTGLQPVRDADRLPSMLQPGVPSQPTSPATPGAPPVNAGTYQDRTQTTRTGRYAIRHQRSISGESFDATNDINHTQPPNEPIVDIQSGVDMERDSMMESVDEPMTLPLTHTETQDIAETFNITHRSPIDGSLLNPAGPVNPIVGFSPNPPTINPTLSIGSLQMRNPAESSSSVVPSSMPREEDVLMSLQLLAYVSKYCNLRTYFQRSHLVPRLSIEPELYLLDDEHRHNAASAAAAHKKYMEKEEYLLPDNYNIFPLVEKFTVRHHPQDMQYWAGVVMRNLCRKDDSKGGIRQCAYYECGKWEEYTRQFAKCRRCRRTKYCSKECQKSAWVYHRHWCVAAQP